MNDSNITLVAASAGTGKTHRLTETVVRAIVEGRARPEGVVAITYTRRAAAELAGRIRRALMQTGRWDAATRLGDGYLGTIHSVSDRLLREFPLQAGMSPDHVLLDEVGKQRLFGEAIDAVVEEHREIGALARRMSAEPEWVSVVRDLVRDARANGIDADGLRACGLTSTEEVAALLGASADEHDDWSDALSSSLAAVVAAHDHRHRSKVDTERLKVAHRVQRDLRDAGPAWGDLEALSTEIAGLRWLDAVSPAFIAAVDRHRTHPRFHDDVKGLTSGVFRVAAAAIDAYEQKKRAHRAIDYDDMLVGALNLLEQDDVADEIAHRVDLVVVDEFQDTSPLQLAILTRLAEVCGGALWVGDPKQAIYSFQGADPELMRAAVAAAAGEKPIEVLSVSRRSRPGLVKFTSDLFVPALGRHGHRPEQVAIGAVRTDPPGLVDTPFLELWGVRGDDRYRQRKEAQAIACGIAASLADQTPVEDGVLRPARAGDFAVLVYSNKGCELVAESLRRFGIPVRVRLSGLLTTTEARLVRAALGIVADPNAVVPAMELAWLGGGGALDADAWLQRATVASIPFDDDALVKVVRELATTARDLDPIEVFDRIIHSCDVVERCSAWPEAGRRLANVEALRAEVRTYADECALSRRACTVAGLVGHLEDLEQRAERTSGAKDARAAMGTQQAMPSDPDAVTVTTWHAAKGLEWRIVVLGSLDWERRDSPFDLAVEPADVFDATRPLAGRRVRWWANPYPGRANTTLAHRAAATPAARRREQRLAEERVRLLYVGFTRARDRLILAVDTTTKPADRWLCELEDADGRRLLRLPYDAVGTRDDVADAVLADGTRVPCRVRTLRATLPQPVELPRRTHVLARGVPESRHAEVVHPSSVDLEGQCAVVVKGALAMEGRVRIDAPVERMDDVGNAIHGFLLSDDPAAPVATRRAHASRAITAFDVAGMVQPDDLLKNGDALFRFVTTRLGKARWLREWPVRWVLPDGRVMVGEIDLLLDFGDRYVVVDHKAFPGDAVERDERVRHHAGQLAAYRAAVERATGKPVAHLYLHFPARGEMQEVGVPKDAFQRWLSASAGSRVTRPPLQPELTLPAAEPVPEPAAEPVPEPDPARPKRKATEPPPPEQLGLPFGPPR